ncbi:lysine--tRNA ligase [Candidatus Uhrbacteria bacterium]|nr:lysine--tRNA ligase [Candidatus Uhrbacteria bacterium]
MIQEEHDNIERVAIMRAAGMDPYPAEVFRTHTIGSVLLDFDGLSLRGQAVTVAGRVRLIRKHGGLTFGHVEDETGRIQFALKRDVVGEVAYDQFHQFFTMGDFIEVTGTLFKTKTAEMTISVTLSRMLAKALLPLPEKWHGLADPEARMRQRYLDFLTNPLAKDYIRKRAAIMRALRNVLEEEGFLDVETPTLQPIYGGGFARPFTTHHNALGADFYLRISDEMYLKRLIVGGFEKVYEITKVFRNEGIDRDHNPEFTMFEAQAAYKDYRWGMDIFERLFEESAKRALGTTDIVHEEAVISVARPWKRMTMVEAIHAVTGEDVLGWNEVDLAKASARKCLTEKGRAELDKLHRIGEVIGLLFEDQVEEQLIQPTIVYDYPVETSPLAKRCEDPRFVQRFEAFALGMEVGNNYTELNDPQDLWQRFVEEKKKEEAGFDEAHQTDEDYLEAIKHGFPPTCGLGIGFDRMVMLLTGAKNIKEVMAFPTLRPKEE